MNDSKILRADGVVFLAMVADAVRAFTAQGLPLEPLLEGTGLSAGQLNVDRSSRQLVPFGTLKKIYDHAKALTNHKDLGLRLGMASGPGTYGVLSYIMMSSATAIDAINQALRYQKIILGSSTTLSLHVEKGAGVLRLNHCQKNHPGAVIYVEQLFSGFLKFSSTMTGQPALMSEVHLCFPDQGYHESYEWAFQCPVRFNQTYNEMVFRTDIMGASLPNADPLTLDACLTVCEDLMGVFEEEDSFATQVSTLLQQHWQRQPDMLDVAAFLGCDVRTVRRKLQAEATSFRVIKDNVRKKIAINELKSTSRPIQEIAQLVGYGEASNFRRAFMKWTGKHPGYYRN